MRSTAVRYVSRSNPARSSSPASGPCQRGAGAASRSSHAGDAVTRADERIATAPPVEDQQRIVATEHGERSGRWVRQAGDDSCSELVCEARDHAAGERERQRRIGERRTVDEARDLVERIAAPRVDAELGNRRTDRATSPVSPGPAPRARTHRARTRGSPARGRRPIERERTSVHRRGIVGAPSGPVKASRAPIS
jgi:hypothetical protein